jgi:hypothetical protein
MATMRRRSCIVRLTLVREHGLALPKTQRFFFFNNHDERERRDCRKASPELICSTPHLPTRRRWRCALASLCFEVMAGEAFRRSC